MSEQSIEDQIKGLRQAALLIARQTGKENAQWVYRAADTIERLREQLVNGVELLREVCERGLIYWEPQTTRGAMTKADMQARIGKFLADHRASFIDEQGNSK